MFHYTVFFYYHQPPVDTFLFEQQAKNKGRRTVVVDELDKSRYCFHLILTDETHITNLVKDFLVISLQP